MNVPSIKQYYIFLHKISLQQNDINKQKYQSSTEYLKMRLYIAIHPKTSTKLA